MKWPETLTLVRHDLSSYNALKQRKEEDPLYASFRKAFDKSPESGVTGRLAAEVVDHFSVNVGDHDTPLAQGAGWQAKKVGEELKRIIKLPNFIFVSPYLRAHLTLDKMQEGWPELKEVKTIEEERIREQDHGLSIVYNDWRVFDALHPEQIKLRKIQGPYWYRYPQGENIPDVRERLRSWLTTLARDYSGKRVLAVTHHLTILSLRANLERLDANEFIRLDHEEKPINCGVTVYGGNPKQGQDGKLILEAYNLNLYAPGQIQANSPPKLLSPNQ